MSQPSQRRRRSGAGGQSYKKGASAAIQRTSRATRTLEPVDYSADYAYIKRDLILIAQLSTVLLIAMVALYYAIG